MHREELGTAADQAERDVEVSEREVVAAIADDDRGDLAGPAASASSARQQALAVELAERVGRGEDEERSAG